MAIICGVTCNCYSTVVGQVTYMNKQNVLALYYKSIYMYGQSPLFRK